MSQLLPIEAARASEGLEGNKELQKGDSRSSDPQLLTSEAIHIAEVIKTVPVPPTQEDAARLIQR